MKSFYSLLFLFFWLTPQIVLAQESGSSSWICNSIFKSKNVGCGDFAGGNSTGGSYPLLKDAFDLNPASLPTVETPVGVEYFWDRSKSNVALIKGTGKTGFGMAATATERPFFSNVNNAEVAQLKANQSRRSSDTESTGLQAPNVNLGSALNILEKADVISSNLGLNLKYVNGAKEFRPGLGWNFKTAIFNGGYSFYKSPSVGFSTTASLGAKIWNFMADITYMENSQGDPNRTLISSATFAWGRLNMTYAYRVQSDKYLTVEQKKDLQLSGSGYRTTYQMFGANYHFGDKLSVGIYNNYILNGGYSLLLQYFF